VTDETQHHTTVDVAHVPTPALFYGLLAQRFTGRLELEQPGTPPVLRRVQFSDGMPTWTDWEQDGSRLGELATAHGHATRAAVDAALADRSERRLGEVLVAAHALTEDNLATLLRSQCARRLLDLFALSEGTAQLVAEAPSESNALPVNVLELIQRGISARYDASRLRRDLGPAWIGRFKGVAELDRYIEQFAFRAEDGSVLGYLASGAEATIAELGAMPDTSMMRAGQVVAVLWHCQMIEAIDAPPFGDRERFEADLAALEARISAGHDPVAIIGVSADAPTAEIESAWLQLATRFDPRGLPDDEDEALRERVGGVAESLDQVRAAARRRRLALAEIGGLRLVGEAKHARGLALLEEATELGASSPEIDCAMVWARLHTGARGPAELEAADVVLARTLAEHPTVPLGHYYRGCVLGWRSKPKESAAAFRRALELDPRLVDAERQLRALSKGERPAEPAPRKRADEGFSIPRPAKAGPTHELLTPGYRRLYWFAGIMLVLLIAANLILRLDADF